MLVELSTQKDQSQSYGSPKLANEEMATKYLLATSSPNLPSLQEPSPQQPGSKEGHLCPELMAHQQDKLSSINIKCCDLNGTGSRPELFEPATRKSGSFIQVQNNKAELRAGCGREKKSRADGYKLSLGVIADRGNVVTQSAEIRKDTDTKTPKEAEVYQWPWAGPSVSPA